MPGVPLLDELMANAWRPVIAETHGGWRYRWASGVTRRANSALALVTDGSVEELVARAEAFYGKRGAPTLTQVTTASAPQSLVAYLQERGYRSTARTLVERAATRDVFDRTQPCTYEIEITPAREALARVVLARWGPVVTREQQTRRSRWCQQRLVTAL